MAQLIELTPNVTLYLWYQLKKQNYENEDLHTAAN